MATTKLKGNLVNLSGNEINVSDSAPVINLAGKDLSDVQIGGSQDKAQVIVVVPSLDTAVCAAETRRFNEEASKNELVQVSVVSMDLPFAMGRFCTTEGIDNLTVASDFRNKDFANAYGVLIADGPLAGVTARAIFIVNAKGIVTYKEICAEITEEPNYDAALSAIADVTNVSW